MVQPNSYPSDITGYAVILEVFHPNSTLEFFPAFRNLRTGFCFKCISPVALNRLISTRTFHDRAGTMLAIAEGRASGQTVLSQTLADVTFGMADPQRVPFAERIRANEGRVEERNSPE
jgi:hypothetical protein